jgi:PGF-pre-PGF domain-containing protein
VDTNASSTVGTSIGLFSGETVNTMVTFVNMSSFLPNSAYDNGTVVVFMRALAAGEEVYYIENDAGTIVHKLSQCAGNTAPPLVNNSTKCYTNSTSPANVTVYVPHLSGVALTSDTIAPLLVISIPSATVNNSFFTLTFNASEANPKNATTMSFCWYNVTNASGQVASWAGFLTTPTPSGVDYIFTKNVSALSDGAYNVTVNCTDLNNQTNQTTTAFTVTDAVAPTMTVGGSSSGLVRTITVTTDEIAECRYSNESGALFSNMTEFTATNATSHSVAISLPAGSYTYYVVCVDVAGNPASEVNTTFSVAVVSESTTCNPLWSCTAFGACSANGLMTRTCTDIKNCNDNSDKPQEVLTCVPTAPCVESWTCGAWGECSESGYQVRSCGDSNHCGTFASRPVELQTCIYTPTLVTGVASVTDVTGGAQATIPAIAAGDQQSITMPVIASTSTGVSKIVLFAKNAVANVTLTIKSAQPSIPAPNGTLIKYLDISATGLNAGDLDKATITFQIGKSQVQNVANVRLAHYVNGAWVVLPTVFTGETSDSYTFEAETPGFSYFAVIEERAAVTPSVCTTTCAAGKTQNAYPDCGCVAVVVPAKADYGIFIFVILLVIAAVYYWYSQQKPRGKKK